MADFEDVTVRLADLADHADELDVIEGKTFERCRIIGPGVIVPTGCRFMGIAFEGDPTSVMWVVGEKRARFIGAVRFVRCSFERCSFSRVGLGLTKDAAADFVQALSETRSDPLGESASAPAMAEGSVAR